MSACDFCDEQHSVISWRRVQPLAGQASACQRCHEALGRAAIQTGRTRQEIGALESRAHLDEGELWDAGATAYWYAPESSTTPTRANVRRVEVAVGPPIVIATP